MSVVHSRNEQIVAITLCFGAAYPCPLLPAPFPSLCRIFPCSTLLSLLSHQAAACQSCRRCMLSDACRQHIKHIHPSIHSSACPLANDAPTAYLGAPNCCPLHVHIDGLPLLATAPFCVAINVITFSNCIQSVHGLPTHPLGDLRLIPIVPAGREFSRQFQPGNFPAVSVIRFANRISRLDIDDSRQN